MTTSIVHASVQRTRFTHHTLAALAGLIPLSLRQAFRTSQPTLVSSAADAAAIEAQRVREIADSYAKSDPGFASDLYAAAARHETLHGV